MPSKPYPGLGRKRLLGLNFGAAAVAILLLAATGSNRTSSEWIETLLYSLLFANSIGTILSYSLLPVVRLALPFPMDWIALIGGILAAAAAGDALVVLILIAFRTVPATSFRLVFFDDLQMCMVVALIFGIAVSLYEREHWKAEQAANLATEARLASLESRIQPHFLFNTLNSISALIHEDPDRAEVIVGRLAALLRSSLDVQTRVPLSQEIELVRDYLEIEKARFGNRLRYSLQVAPEMESALVPALSLQTLVENSVKFAVAHRREGGTIEVLAQAGGSNLVLEVRDDGPGFDSSSLPSGHGLESLKSRLEALFGSAARLEISSRPGQTTVRMVLPHEVARLSA